MVIFAIVFFIVLYKLPMDQNTKIVSAISAISSILIFVTVIQAYQSYQQTAKIQNITFNTEAWKDILNNVDDDSYKGWYEIFDGSEKGPFNGLTMLQHKSWSRIATNIEAFNDLNGMSKNGFNFNGFEGWRSMSWYWLNDPGFKAYWETDSNSFNKETWKYVEYFQNLTHEENAKLEEKERQMDK